MAVEKDWTVNKTDETTQEFTANPNTSLNITLGNTKTTNASQGKTYNQTYENGKVISFSVPEVLPLTPEERANFTASQKYHAPFGYWYPQIAADGQPYQGTGTHNDRQNIVKDRITGRYWDRAISQSDNGVRAFSSPDCRVWRQEQVLLQSTTSNIGQGGQKGGFIQGCTALYVPAITGSPYGLQEGILYIATQGGGTTTCTNGKQVAMSDQSLFWCYAPSPSALITRVGIITNAPKGTGTWRDTHLFICPVDGKLKFSIARQDGMDFYVINTLPDDGTNADISLLSHFVQRPNGNGTECSSVMFGDISGIDVVCSSVQHVNSLNDYTTGVSPDTYNPINWDSTFESAKYQIGNWDGQNFNALDNKWGVNSYLQYGNYIYAARIGGDDGFCAGDTIGNWASNVNTPLGFLGGAGNTRIGLIEDNDFKIRTTDIIVPGDISNKSYWAEEFILDDNDGYVDLGTAGRLTWFWDATNWTQKGLRFKQPTKSSYPTAVDQNYPMPAENGNLCRITANSYLLCFANITLGKEAWFMVNNVINNAPVLIKTGSSYIPTSSGFPSNAFLL